MIYQVFGQARTARRGVTAPREGEAVVTRAVEPEPTGFLPTSQAIASAIIAILKTGYGITADQAVRMADNQMNPDQRFFEVEFHHAAILLAQSYPSVYVSAWLQLLGNYMGWRKRAIPTCPYRQVIDPVTRECVPETVPAVEIPEVPEVPEVPELPKEKEPFKVPAWAWGAGIGLGVLILLYMGGRR